MHVQYVVLCDQVVLGADGKPSLIGVFNDVQIEKVPVTIPRLAFVARIHFTPDEAGRTHRIEVAITDPEGRDIAKPNGELNLPPVPPGMDSVSVDLPIHLDMFELGAPGRYTFLLHVDGAPAAAVQMSVKL
jgi:uncharacterized protein DUF6941